MSRILGVCWIFLWITTAADVSAKYVLNDEAITWHAAKDRGNFATPNIHMNSPSKTVDVEVNLLQNKEAWVGYYMKETAFAYIGCGRINNEIAPLSIWRNSPGFCYSMCDKSHQNYVGLNKERCFCMSEKPSLNITLSACNISDKENWVAGGGDEYMSIYEIMKTDITVNGSQHGGMCLVFQNKLGIWWNSCKTFTHALCKKVADTTFHDFKYFEWTRYVKTCFENQYYPITFSDIKNCNIVQATGQTWTNVIRSNVIYKYNELPNCSISKENVKKYGYIFKHRSMAVLNFTKESNMQRYFLQLNSVTKPTSETIWTSTTRQVPDNSSTYNVTFSTKSLTQETRTTSTKTATTTATTRGQSTQTFVSSGGTFSQINDTYFKSTEGFKSAMSASDSSDVSIPVSVSVVATILVAVVVVVIVTLKRRGKFKEICTKITAPDNTPERKAETVLAEKIVYVESPISDYEQISELQDNNNVDVKPDLDVEHHDYGHNYFILEPGSRESNTDGDVSDSRKEDTEMNDDYNTLHSNKTLGAKADDTYDTTEKAAIKLKALQNTGCEKEFLGKLNENEEDTYNHISRNLLKNNKTDNIYGVTDNQENDYGDVNNGCEKNIHDGDDTYSHLNTAH